MRGYEMRVLEEEVTPATTNHTISIDYELPDAGFLADREMAAGRCLFQVVPDRYGRWQQARS